jgi:hypothetical protein
MRKIVSMTSVVALLLAVGARGGEPKAVKPGPEHEKFKEVTGAWDAKCEMGDKEFKGSATFSVGLGGLWHFQAFTADFGGGKFEGKGASTYDPASKKYINIWIDSMSTTPMVSEGNYDKQGRLILKGKKSHDGKQIEVTMTTEFKDKNTMIFTMVAPGPDGKEGEMKITYTRKKNSTRE